MQDIPIAIMALFLERLKNSNIPAAYHAEYLQWLRYYLDFAATYPMPDSKAERVRIFCEKLAIKNRTADQQRRAAHAVSLYSRKTLQTYAKWSRRFQHFLKNKPPNELSSDDVKDYLTFLAVKCHVAASTQNQAFNALLFLYRHALKTDFGILRDIPRAKKSLYIPVVLSRQEIDAILNQHLLQANYDIRIIQKLLGHASLKTTMIYTHCVPVRTVQEPRSPLDF